MASAPAPGIGNRKAEAAGAKTVMTITIKGESHSLAVGNVPFQERLLVRKATGIGFEQFFAGGETAIGTDSIQVLWWLARRASGEWQLTLDKSNEEFPEGLGEDDFDITIDDGKDDSPEA